MRVGSHLLMVLIVLISVELKNLTATMKPPLSCYVLGVGAIGGLVAHELTLAHPSAAQVSLLFKNSSRLNSFNTHPELVVNRVLNDDNISTTTTKIKGTTAKQLTKLDPLTKMDNLIVSTKAFQSTAALSKVIDMIDTKTNILFIHNGMGVIDECIQRYWPLHGQRPNLFKAVVTHGAYKTSPNVINHVGLGGMKVSYIPTANEQKTLEQAPELIKMLVESTPNLNGEYMDFESFTIAEIEKLAVNACVNPLTAILDCLNGDLLYGSKIVKIMRKVIDELILVIRQEHWAVLEKIPHVNTLLDKRRLLDIVFEVIQTTAKNSSSMREDVRNLNTTEIDYINGYISRLGQKHSIPTSTNNMLVSMVKTKLTIEKSIDITAADLVI